MSSLRRVQPSFMVENLKSDEIPITSDKREIKEVIPQRISIQ
jgi:hypothetical protein